MERKEIFVAIGQALFAVFGSCVKWLNAKEKEPLSALSFVSGVASAAFSGALVYLVYSFLNMNIYIAFALAGIVGNQGAKGLDMLGKFIIKQTGIKDDNAKKDD